MMKKNIFALHASLLKAIAHEKRLEILQLLRAHELNVSQIVEMSGLRQSNVSQHLMVLKEAGVVIGNKRGKEIYYSVRHKNFVKASDLIRSVLIEDHQKDEIGKELMELPDDLEPKVKDLVCSMELTPRTASHTYSYNGVQHYFCGKGCLNQFVENPTSYI